MSQGTGDWWVRPSCAGLRPMALTLWCAGRDELDLLRSGCGGCLVCDNAVDQVYLAAAKVGGIHANDTYPAEFLRDNLVIQTNVIHSAWQPWRRKARLPGFFLHLSQARSPADARRLLADRAA